MTRNALRRGSSIVAGVVAVGTRQGAVLSVEVTANFGVIELRRRKGPLVVAGATARRERVGMDVVLAVAVDAQVPRAREPTIVDVAAIAALLIVCPLELEVANIMQGYDV